MRFRDPQHPTLAELLIMDQDDASYLHHLYWHLLGREPDSVGLKAYRERLPRVGRLFTLAAILCSAESQQYLSAEALRLPTGARRLARLCPLLKSGRGGRLLLAPLVLLGRLWEWRRRHVLALEARCLRAEARLTQQQQQIEELLVDVDDRLSELELLQMKRRRSAAEVQRLRDRIRGIMHHGLDNETGVGEPAINAFDHRGESQQRLLEALEVRWRADS